MQFYVCITLFFSISYCILSFEFDRKILVHPAHNNCKPNKEFQNFNNSRNVDAKLGDVFQVPTNKILHCCRFSFFFQKRFINSGSPSGQFSRDLQVVHEIWHRFARKKFFSDTKFNIDGHRTLLVLLETFAHIHGNGWILRNK